jgi:hypothetical protein
MCLGIQLDAPRAASNFVLLTMLCTAGVGTREGFRDKDEGTRKEIALLG